MNYGIGLMSAKRLAFIIFVMFSVFLTGCVFRSKKVSYSDDMPEICEEELRNCFGEQYVLSEGVEREKRFLNEFEDMELISYYTEWNLTYKDAGGEERSFVFNNYLGRKQAKEHMEKSMENYFSDLVEQYYKQNFWNKAVAGISGCKEDDSVLYFQKYQLFTKQDVPETSVMYDERVQYSLAENIYFPELQYDEVFSEFPYILNTYLTVMYEVDDEEGRIQQRQETEMKLREMINEIIHYTNGSLNATVHVTMMDENGYADGFNLAILDGEYFADGPGTKYEIALHENFFGAIQKE